MSALTGMRILVTRPAHQASAWCETLAREGAEAVAVPLLELVPVSTPEQLQALKDRVLDFDLYQKVIFVSQNAVAHAMEWLDNYWPQLPVGIEYFAVGASTAGALSQQGLRAQAPGGAMNSEALLQDPALQPAQVAEKRILIFRGVGGRPYMAQVLAERGARVDFAELYERRLPDDAADQLIATFTDPKVWQQKQVVALHSGESLHNYRRLLDQLALDPQRKGLTQALVQLPVLVPGERVAQLARELGFEQVLTAENATDASMLATLKQH
ncbi:uroporphyrinogen-III synthase [Marinimicrobium sp. ABcell2]|uniref:uroporphyrinogen-III synthase n=1 Tax=Marinimicrobium sp. ABcell2 TaxID=3069751 RepID=UPI0027AFB830|nr:uroporphyrinogen-III synthase [Marinimicrobium sp. ABcell2]MDQ2076937.1 uroporphyrinogen-III synthase [Marinimicrobium sp. ABcell2]